MCMWSVHKNNYIPPSRQLLQDCLDVVALLGLSHIHQLILHLGETQVVNKPKSEYMNTYKWLRLFHHKRQDVAWTPTL